MTRQKISKRSGNLLCNSNGPAIFCFLCTVMQKKVRVGVHIRAYTCVGISSPLFALAAMLERQSKVTPATCFFPCAEPRRRPSQP
ncbi:hypothetical protein BCV70DRAFT_123272 [Testicularia cyperi]|uniref:Uncharacterized protein n=1 Tax=Testicularia cyperi TaxID=1882483 RepID=A0A317XL75_9BASI|nr:hypothetical protein BCV70DRAFT_123272 [Testicularia cyperi]